MQSFVNTRVFVLISTIINICTVRPTAYALAAFIVCAHAGTSPLLVTIIDTDR